jgi:hypothetical protein
MTALSPLVVSNFWDGIRQQIRQYGEKADAYTILDWPPILQTINIGPTPPYLETEMNALTDAKYNTAIMDVVDHAPETWKTTVKANLVHQAHHLQHWENKTGKKVEDIKSVGEVGGGLGFMRVLFHYLNPACEYAIYDFPELTLCQELVTAQLNNDTPMPMVFINRPDDVEMGIKEHFGDVDLLISMWAMSEIPSTRERENLLSAIDIGGYLFAYQTEHEAVDNNVWFSKLIAKERAFHWASDSISHLGPTNRYLVGWKE